MFYNSINRLRQPVFANQTAQPRQQSTAFGGRQPAFVGGQRDLAPPGLQQALQRSQGWKGRMSPFSNSYKSVHEAGLSRTGLQPRAPTSGLQPVTPTMPLGDRMQPANPVAAPINPAMSRPQAFSQRMSNANQRVSSISTGPRNLRASPWGGGR